MAKKKAPRQAGGTAGKKKTSGSKSKAAKKLGSSTSGRRRAAARAGPGVELLEAAARAVKGALRAKPGEMVLLVTDLSARAVTEALVHWLEHVRVDLVPYLLADMVRPLRGLPGGLRRLATRADATLALFRPRPEEGGLLEALAQAATARGRFCDMTGVDASRMERLVNVNYPELQDLARRVVERVSGAREVRVTSPEGTDVRFSVYGRPWQLEAGDLGQPGARGPLPAGRIHAAPVEETFAGTVAFRHLDGRRAVGSFRFEKGRVVGHTGRSAAALLTAVGRDPGGKLIGEVGIGMNRNARIGGDRAEAERAFGTVHFVIGDSGGLGKSRSKHRHEVLVEKPTLVADGETILEEGRFRV